ncbi:hypothetical protein [Paenibacillus sp. 23TSA30-6]|uniref:hypothetical protein n=1 Tax=Paenibacillus sp. 23TSA30-6 TaxID=2546104 RepID=UPI0017888B1F|nr:hypothetical protein [Paenibacillus sp. 23TSA30-6]MBE0335103.1 hypothetical protein [Paenibacillus sp. 23TSA30-6]
MIVSAEFYHEGLEDGFEFYALSGQFIGYIPKDEMANGYPKAKRVPIVQTPEGRKPVNEGDCIITDNQGNRYVMEPCGFRQEIGTVIITTSFSGMMKEDYEHLQMLRAMRPQDAPFNKEIDDALLECKGDKKLLFEKLADIRRRFNLANGFENDATDSEGFKRCAKPFTI